MKHKSIVIAVVSLWTISLFAQVSTGTLDLRTNYFYNFEIYYLLDFDFNNGRNNPDMFSYSLSYTPNDPQGAPIKIKLEFEWLATVPSLNLTNSQIVYMLSNPFDFKGEVVLTTKDFDQNMRNLYYTDGRQVPISITEFKQNVERLKAVIMATGKLPAGSYIFKLNIMNESGSVLKSQTQEIGVSNPSTLELISPGGTLDQNLEIATTFPQFQWESIDFMWSSANCPTCGYSIRIAEYDPAKHSSVEEALHDRANLPYPDNGGEFRLPSQAVTSRAGVGLYTAGTIFQYPMTGAKPLEAGKTYVWQIKKTYPTTSGPETISSQIFAFTIKASMGGTSTAGGTTTTTELSQYMTLLTQLLDPDTYNRLFTGELTGFTPTGVVTLNATQNLTYEQLTALVAQFLSGQVTIKSISVE